MSGLDWLDDGPDEWTRRYVESVWADCPISAILVLLAMLLAPLFWSTP